MRLKKLVNARLIPLALAVITLGTAKAQTIFEGKAASDIYADVTMVRESNFSDLPSYIRFSESTNMSAEQAMIWLKKNLKLGFQVEFDLITTQEDDLGHVHFRFQQMYNGIPVEGAVWLVHTYNDRAYSVNGFILQTLPGNGNASLTETQALEYALDYVNAEVYKWELQIEEDHLKKEQHDNGATYFPTGELVFAPRNGNYTSEAYRLAYKFNIYAHDPVGRSEIYVDATTGEIIYENEIIHHADVTGTAETQYSGTQTITTDSFGGQYRLRESGRGNGIETYDMNEGTSYGASVDFTDADNYWNNVNAQLDEYATDAHYGAEMTYDYFWLEHGRNSIDGSGFALLSYVHYDNNYANAFWDGARMTYGDGGGGWNPLVAMDIAGHEITHGLTTFTANLVYQDEPGALNESFSDIFGTCIEEYAQPTWDWLVGEDIGSALRSMSNPNSYGDPDTYFGTNWAPLGGPDNGGVHTNSGVQNYWFYLLTQGGSGTNDNGDGYTVNGLGITDASRIAFRNLTVYLSVNSQFSDARFYAIQSATDIFGGCSPEVIETTNAWYAVGVGAAYVVAPPSASFTAPVASSCSAPFTVDFTNTSVNGSGYEWDFGDGGTSTSLNPSYTYNTAGTYTVELVVIGGACGPNDTTIMVDFIDIDPGLPCIVNMPPSGTGNLQTGCNGTLYDSGGGGSDYGANEDAQITIAPIGAATVDLDMTFFDIEPGPGGTCDYDFLEIYDGPNTGSPLIGQYCNNNPPPATVSSTGGAITLVFHSDPGLELAGYQIDWNCVLSGVPPNADFTANVTTTCTGTVNFTDLSTNGPTSWSWDFGDGGSSTSQNPTYTYTSSGLYTVTLTATNGIGNDVATQVDYIQVNIPTAPTTTDDAICAGNTASLGASGGSNLVWYDAPSGGTQVNTGTSYTTPVLGSTTTYYVEEEVVPSPQNVGPLDNSFGGGGYFNGDQHLVFDVTTPVTLVSVWVDANSSGNRTIELRDNVGVVLESATINIPAGQSRVTLNFTLPAGTNFQLGTINGGTPDLYRNNSGPSYPYTLAGIVDITSSSAGNNYYYFFYDWEIQEPSCISPRTPVTATVTPNADATITPAGPYCSSDASATMNAVDGGGTWSGPGMSGNTFDPASAGAGSHTITYTITGMCGDSDTEIIVVNASQDANITPAGPYCSGDSPITMTAVDGGGSWSGPGMSGSTFDPASAGVGSHTITYTIGGSCGDTDTETIVVNASQDATISPAGPFCISDAPVTMTAVDAGGTWSGSGMSGSTFDPASAGVGSHTITYTISGSCGDTDTETIVVSSSLDATITPAGPYCSGDSPITMTAVDGGGTWSGPGMSGSTFDPASAGAGSHTITYTISGSCGDTDTETIVVNASQDATITPAGPYCEGDSPVTMTAVDGGGTWSGPGMSGSTFDPASAGAGSHTITYTISGSCGDSDTETIVVNSSQDATITPAGPLCESDGVITLSAVDAGGTWSGTGVSGSTFNPASAGAGTHTITYTITGACGDTDTEDIVVIADADATISAAGPFCDDDALQTMNAIDAGGTWSADCGSCINSSTGEFDPVAAGAGTYTIYYDISGTCGDIDSVTVTVNNCTGIATNELALGFTIFPNPANNDVWIEVFGKVNGMVRLEVLNTIGQVILIDELSMSGNNMHHVDLSEFERGVYFIRVSNEEFTVSKKLIRQ